MRTYTRDELVVELLVDMVEFGIPIEIAVRGAPLAQALLQDPRGARQAICEEFPALAEHRGWIWRQ